MSEYIRFDAAQGGVVLIEVDDRETTGSRGVVKAGLKSRAEETIAVAQTTFEEAVRTTLQSNARAFLGAIEDLQEPPTEAEMSFSLKATGELGNLAIGKLGGEANYSIKLVWKRSADRP